VHNHNRFGLFYLSKSQAIKVVQYYTVRADALMLKHLLRRIDAANVWERREQLGRQFHCGFADSVERFRSPHSDGKVSV